jgi:sugar phosphate isomerase/epimerase
MVVNGNLIKDGKYHTAVVDVGAYAFWQGKINQLRFDFFGSGVAGDVMYVKSIRLLESGESKPAITIEGTCVDFATEEGCQKQIECFKKSIIGAKYLGCPQIVVHPFMPGLETNSPSKEELPLNVRLWKQVASFAREHGIVVCIENVAAPNGTLMSYIENIKWVFDEVGDEYIKACLDTGHFEAVGTDICGAICLLGDHLAALHVHDSAFGQDRHNPPFQALVDWKGFTKGLKAIGFKGAISLETMICTGTPQPMLDQMQRALSGIARYLATEAGGE